ncbi:MAG: Calx-beta domain-containing protein [Lachnospira sp.]|nr:Calx-beta domain-containing protein [Lachnospira sp.]
MKYQDRTKRLHWRRWIGLGLAVVLTVTPALPARAEEPAGAEAFTFVQNAILMSMDDKVECQVKRQGDLSQDTTVTFSTMDLLAGYGEDYHIVLEDGSEVEGSANRVYGTVSTYEVYPGKDTVNTDSSTQSEETETTPQTENKKDTDESMKSATFELHFPAGESTATFSIVSEKPEEVKDDLPFTISMESTSTGEIGEIGSLMVTIEEEREREKAVISIDPKETTFESGYARVHVRRSGNIWSTIQYAFTTNDQASLAGVDYEPVNQKLTFTPGVTEQVVNVALYKDAEAQSADKKSFAVAVNSEADGGSTSSGSIEYAAQDVATTQTATTERNRIELPVYIGNGGFKKSTANGDKTECVTADTNTGQGIYMRTDLNFGSIFNDDKGVSAVYFGNNMDVSGKGTADIVAAADKIDFTGISGFEVEIKTGSGDDNDYFVAYASDTDLCKQHDAQKNLAKNKTGLRLTFETLEAENSYNIKTYDNCFNVAGKHNLFLTMSHAENTGDEKFWVKNFALIKRDYYLHPNLAKIIDSSGKEMKNAAQPSDQMFTLTSDANVQVGSNPERCPVYNGETFRYSDTPAANTSYELKGFEYRDSTGSWKTLESDGEQKNAEISNMFTVDSELIINALGENKFKDTEYAKEKVIQIRPVYEVNNAEIQVTENANYASANLKLEIDENHNKALLKDKDGKTQGAVKWNSHELIPGAILNFEEDTEVELASNDYILLGYIVKYTAAGGNKSNSNEKNYIGATREITVEPGVYEVQPIFVKGDYVPRLIVKNGGLEGADFTGRSKADKDSDGTYISSVFLDPSDLSKEKEIESENLTPDTIAGLCAKAPKGYRCQWSYRNVASNKTVTVYGEAFYYRFQMPSVASDNTITLEFVQVKDGEETKDLVIKPTVSRQAGTILERPTENSSKYEPIEGAEVSIGAYRGITDAKGVTQLVEGKTDTTMDVIVGEQRTVYVEYNHMQYVQTMQMKLNESGDTSVAQELKLSYYSGPYVEEMCYVDGNGDVYSTSTVSCEPLVTTTFYMKLNAMNRHINQVLLYLQGTDGVEKTYKAELCEDTYKYKCELNLGEITIPGAELYVELLYDDDKGNVTSYGKEQSGYNLAEFMDWNSVIYLPAMGIDVPAADAMGVKPGLQLGNFTVSPMFSFKGVSPILNVMNKGDMVYINVGASIGVYQKKSGQQAVASDKKIGAIDKYKEDMLSAINDASVWKNKASYGSFFKDHEEKASFTVSVTVCAQVVLANANGKCYYAGTYLYVGAGETADFTETFMVGVWPLPIIVRLSETVKGGFKVGLMPKNGWGAMDKISTQASNSYMSHVDLNFDIIGGVALGTGFKNVLDIELGGNLTSTLVVSDFSKGTETISFDGIVSMQLILGQASYKFNIASHTWKFGYDEVTQAEGQSDFYSQAIEEQLAKFQLTDFSWPTVGTISKDNVDMDTKAAYTPSIYPLANSDTKYVVFYTRKETMESKVPVLFCGIWDTEQSKMVQETPINQTQEGVENVEYAPVAVEIATDKFMVAYSSMEVPEGATELKIWEQSSQIQTAIVDVSKIEQGTDEAVANRSVISSSATESQKDAMKVGKLVYDEAHQSVLMLYSEARVSELNENSQMSDYLKMTQTSNYASCNTEQKGEDTKWNKGQASIDALSENQNINSTDISLVSTKDGQTPICLYTAGTLNDKGYEGNNNVYYRVLNYQDDSSYKTGEAVQITDGEQKASRTQLCSADAMVGTTNTVAVWAKDQTLTYTDLSQLLEGDADHAKVEISMNEESADATYQNLQLHAHQDRMYVTWTQPAVVADENTGNLISTSEIHALSASSVKLDGEEDYTTYWTGSVQLQDQPAGEYVASYVRPNAELVYLYTKGDGEVTVETAFQKYALDVDKMEVTKSFPRAGETVQAYVTVVNNGIDVLPEAEVALTPVDVSGKQISGTKVQTQKVSNLYAGHPQTVSFDYTTPNGEETQFRIEVTGTGATAMTKTLPALYKYTDNGLVFTGISYEMQQYPEQADQDGMATCHVRAGVKNMGSSRSRTYTLDMQYMPDVSFSTTKAEESAESVAKSAGSITIPELDAGEETRLEFDIRLDVADGQNGENWLEARGNGTNSGDSMPKGSEDMLGYVPLYACLCEEYGTNNQNIIDYADAFVIIEKAPSAGGLTSEKLVVGEGQSILAKYSFTNSMAALYSTLEFSTDQPEIATIDSNGVVTGVKSGTCKGIIRVAGLEQPIEFEIQVTKEAQTPDNGSDGDSGDGSDVKPGDGAGNDSGGSNKSDKTGKDSQKNKSADTGDTTTTSLWMIILIGSLCVIASILRRKRRYYE